MSQKLLQYVQRQLFTTDERLRRFTHNVDGKTELPKRNMFIRLQKYANDFIEKKSSNRMIIIPGFRGVGKTTLMAQICLHYKKEAANNLNFLFVSIDESMSIFAAGISDLVSAYEEILGDVLESVKEPVFIFLDEIQNDPKWAISLKILYERTTNVFFCCTGSSAVVLQKNITGDLARRVTLEKLPPMCFSEYKMTNNNVYPPKGLKQDIKNAIYFSDSSDLVLDSLLSLKTKVNQYWAKVARTDIKKYLSYGSLPFSFNMPNEARIYDSINILLDKVIEADLPIIGGFDKHTLNNVKKILFAIAENDVTSFKKLEEKFDINWNTISNVFEALEKAELLIKVPAYGANMTVAKKASKYLFMSPAIRMSFFYVTGIENTYMVRQGKLLEDSIGGHLYREFVIDGKGAMRYDSQEGGADFILQILNKKQIIIEVGLGNKDKKQIITSSKKIPSDYNIVFSKHDLELDKKTRTVFIPLDYYFLM